MDIIRLIKPHSHGHGRMSFSIDHQGRTSVYFFYLCIAHLKTGSFPLLFYRSHGDTFYKELLKEGINHQNRDDGDKELGASHSLLT